MAWTTPATAVAGTVLTAAWLNTYVRDNLNAVLGGLVTPGFTLIDLLGAAAPAVSAAGHIKIIHNTGTGTLQSSISGAAFDDVGHAPNFTSALLLSDMLH